MVTLPHPGPSLVEVDYHFDPHALTPEDILLRVGERERELLELLPETVQLLVALLNDAASRLPQRSEPTKGAKAKAKAKRGKGKAKAKGHHATKVRRSRGESRALVVAARVEHPAWTWAQVASACGLSRRYTMELWADARERGEL